MKKDIIFQALTRYVDHYQKLNIDIKNTIGMKDPYYYRNKAQMPVAFDGERVVTGLYEANTNRLTHIDKCLIQDEMINRIIYELRTLMMKHHVMVYNRKNRDGLLRYICVRYIHHTNECQVVLVLSRKEIKVIEQIASEVMEKYKEIVSFFINVNDDLKTHEIYGREFTHIKGKHTINAKLKDSKFVLSPHSFFQLNTRQCEVLYDIVKKTADFKKKDKVVDAYCGAGTIGIYIAKDVEEVRGVDITKQAIHDAKFNADLNKLKNTHFEAGHAEVIIPKWIKEGFKPDVIILDPPRTGIDPKLLEVLRKVKIKKVIYVSCNASTLAKDLNELRRVYQIVSIQPVDMFPQTSHVESVVLLHTK